MDAMEVTSINDMFGSDTIECDNAIPVVRATVGLCLVETQTDIPSFPC